MDITITLTDAQAKALGLRHNTDDVEKAMQDYITQRADRTIKEEYEKEFASKDISDMKTLLPEVKVEKVAEVIE